MNDLENPPAKSELPDIEADRQNSTSQGPNLPLIYSLIALALAAAIGLAIMIVLPFYHRH